VALPKNYRATPAEGTGLEDLPFSQGNEPISADPTHNPTQRESLPKNQAPLDPRLQTIIDRWDALSETTKTKIARWVE
jgi:hypothetical protein